MGVWHFRVHVQLSPAVLSPVLSAFSRYCIHDFRWFTEHFVSVLMSELYLQWSYQGLKVVSFPQSLFFQMFTWSVHLNFHVVPTLSHIEWHMCHAPEFPTGTGPCANCHFHCHCGHDWKQVVLQTEMLEFLSAQWKLHGLGVRRPTTWRGESDQSFWVQCLTTWFSITAMKSSQGWLRKKLRENMVESTIWNLMFDSQSENYQLRDLLVEEIERQRETAWKDMDPRLSALYRCLAVEWIQSRWIDIYIYWYIYINLLYLRKLFDAAARIRNLHPKINRKVGSGNFNNHQD